MGRGLDDKDNIFDDTAFSDAPGVSENSEMIFDHTQSENNPEPVSEKNIEPVSENNIDTVPENTAGDTYEDSSETVFGNTEAHDEEAASAAVVFPEQITVPVKKKHSVLKIVGIVCAAVVVCTYIAVSIWFMFHYNYKTYINDRDYSFYTISEVDDFIQSYIEDYSLGLKLRDGSEFVIKPDDIGLKIKPNVTAKSIKKDQNGFLWPYYIWKEQEYELYYTADYDKADLESLLEKCDFTQEANMEKPVDAKVEIEDGQATIIPESQGNYIDFDQLCCIIDDALARGDRSVELDGTDAYLKPEITSDNDEIVAEQKKLEKVLSMKITYKIDEVSWVLDSKDYAPWITSITGDKVDFNKDKVHEYVQNMADRYDTYDVPRNFRTHDGRTVTLENTWYGWLIDVDEEAEELYEVLKAGKSVERVPLLDCYAAVYRDGGDDIGDTFIECDLGQQHVYVYMKGKLVMDTECVSGSLASGDKFKTPGGVYTILYTKTPAVLVGEDYRTPVKYWMPFIGELGIGFHDATWRGAFGGDIYISGGSHGCVNLPLEAAEQLFNIAYDGMPVVCYY